MASKSKRRSSFFSRAHGLNSSMSESESDMNAVDPESEAEERRARKGLKKRQSMGIPGRTPMPLTPSTVLGSPMATSVSGYSAAQVVEHYMNCMKLSAENKINIKNAFELNVIDCMAEMIKKKESQINNFQAASVGLDASTKIYAFRVDSVHNATLKLASGVGSNKPEKANANDGEGEGVEGHGDEDLVKKKKKRKKASTVEKNLNNINCGHFDLEYQVDPLFKKVSAQFDSGAGGGQFLSTLRMRDDTCELLLDSSALLSEELNAVDNCSPDFLLHTEGILTSLPEDALICPTFSTFTFRNWSVDQEDLDSSSFENRTSINTQDVPQTQDNYEEHAFDPQAIENDDNFFGRAGDDMIDDDNVELDPTKSKPGNHFSHFALWNQMALDIPTEYTYFDKGRLGAWAGPKHWKFKSGHGTRGAIPDAKADARKRRRKEKKPLDVESLEDKNSLILTVVEKDMALPKKQNKLLMETIEKWDNDKFLFPEDIQYKGKNLFRLETLPMAILAPKKQTESQAVDESVDDYNFDNLNDSQNFCPEVQPDENNGDATTAFSQNFINSQSQTIDEGMDLIAAPNKVKKDVIGYARVAKRIDMKRLKRVTLSILHNQSITSEADKENKQSSSNETNDTSASKSKDENNHLNFSDMYKSLMIHKDMPSKQTESLSVPLAFVTLLHLCNENVLALSSTENLEDLVIKKD